MILIILLFLVDHMHFGGRNFCSNLCPFLNGVVFLSFCRNSLYILDTSPLSNIYLSCKYFLPFCGLSFYFLNGDPEAQKFLILTKFSLLFFLLLLVLWCLCLTKGQENLLLFPSKRFIALALTFRSLIHFESIFVYDIK